VIEQEVEEETLVAAGVAVVAAFEASIVDAVVELQDNSEELELVLVTAVAVIVVSSNTIVMAVRSIEEDASLVG